MNTRELRAQRAGLISQARALVEAAEQGNRDLTAEEQTQYAALMAEAANLKARIERAETLGDQERELGQPAGESHRQEPGARDALPGGYEFRAHSLRGLNGTVGQAPEWAGLVGLSGEPRQRAFAEFLRGARVTAESRALAVDPDSAGGYLVAPMQFVDGLIQAVDNAVFMRQWATVIPVPNADSLGAPSLETDIADPTWTSEVLIGSEDSSMVLGQRELHPHPLGKYIKVSRTLVRKAPSVEALVQQRLGYKFSTVLENAYLNGTGTGAPLGVFTASAQGITTARDYSTGNTATAITFDGLIGAKYTLKAQYRAKARWMFHRDGVSQIAKLKDGNGQYIWSPSVVAGQPDRILNMPVFESEYAPNTFTAALYVGILGDFSFYWIADALNLEIQRLVELYAATNQIGFIGRFESDGMPVLAEAFVRVKLGT
jgi:HK97 family phage major capsid protein